MELVTPPNEKRELVKGRVIFLKVPQWISDIPKIVGLGFLILLSVLVYSAILHLFPPVLMLPTIIGISCLIGLIVLVKTYGVK